MGTRRELPLPYRQKNFVTNLLISMMVMVGLLIVTIVMIIKSVPSQRKATQKVNSIIAFLPRDRWGKCGIKFEKKTQLFKIFCCRVVLARSADMYYILSVYY